MTTNLIQMDELALSRPAVAYLARLSPGGRPAQMGALRRIAERLGWPAGWASYPWHQLDRAETLAIRAWLCERYAPATVNRHLAALRGVLQEAWRAGRMDEDRYRRASDLQVVKASRLPAGREASPRDLRRLFQAAGAGAFPNRDRALLAVLVGLGLRRDEAARLTAGDVNLETGEVRVLGKGNKERLTWAGADVLRLLRAWIEERALTPTLFGLKAEAIYKRVRVLALRAGLGNLTPHDLRRTFVGQLLDAGADLSAVKELAGHASIETTARYDRRGERAKQKAAELVRLPG